MSKIFTDEELKFIETILDDELFSILLRRNKIEDYEEVKEYDEIMKPRKEFIAGLLEKIRKLNK